VAAADREYWAFLSYSHTDAEWATWLLRRIETYVIPRDLIGRETGVGPAPRQLRPVFLDREELELNASLGDRIRGVLGRSKYLILICSPQAAQSAWVNEEVAYFRSVHGGSRILCVIVGGEPFVAPEDADAWRECFPPALLERPLNGRVPPEAQPIAADLRPHGDGRRLAVLKLIAGMLGVGLDDLVHRDARRRHRRLVAIAAASFVGMVAMGGLAAAALAARNEARSQKAQAEGLIEFMLSDLRDKLEPAGRLDLLDDVGRRALDHYAAQGRDRLDADSLGRRARVLHLLGSVEDRRGDLRSAHAAFLEAAESTAALLARAPNDPQRMYDHSQSAYWVGYAAYRRGRNDEAIRRFDEYLGLADRLVAIDPSNDAWRTDVADANSSLGTVFLDEGRAATAAGAFARSLAADLELVRRKPGDPQRLERLGQSHAWSADAELAQGRFDQAMSHRLAERKIYADLIARQPSDVVARQALFVNRHGVAAILMQQGRSHAAIGELNLAAAEAQALLATDDRNMEYRQQAAPLYVTLGQLQMASGQLEAARRSADTAVAMAEALVRSDSTVVDWRGRQLGGARVLQMRVRARAARTTAEAVLALAPAPAEFARLRVLAADRPRDLRLARVAAEAAVLAGDHELETGKLAAADAFWRDGSAMLRVAGAEQPDRTHDRARRLLVLLDQRRSDGVRLNSGQSGVRSASYAW
jgi:tetratricopeptide (TPR) repeat protein